jgi:hypothetical protein
LKRARSHAGIAQLLELLDESYVSKAWHGPNLRGSIRGLSAKEAAWRPAGHRHNINEIVIHCAYWKYAVRRRILREKRGSFPLKGSNWFSRPDVGLEASWRNDVELLGTMHAMMMDAIATLSDADLSKIPPESKVSAGAIVRGIASHDIYHAGQIQLLKRLMR